MSKSMNLDWTLRYRHGFGAFAPYFEGLASGRAMATHDPRTARTSFPPHPGEGCEWVELDGAGVIVAITHGPARLPVVGHAGDWTFALIAMDGADNLAFGRVDVEPGAGVKGQRVRLAGAPSAAPEHPAAMLRFAIVSG